MTGSLAWILPPLIGAFIGYVTNLAAIKMLFRPLREFRVFGIRLPFTPGILPRQRRKLADSIAGMVERELLTAGVLRERLAKPEFRQNIGTAIGSYTGDLLARPVSSWLEDPPGGEGQGFPLADALKDFVSSDVCNALLEEIIREWAQRKVPFSGKDDDSFGSWLKSRVRDAGSSVLYPAASAAIKGSLLREIKHSARGDLSLHRRAVQNILSRYPGITLGEFLSLAESKKRRLDSFLAEKAEAVLDDNIERALSSVNVKALVADRINSLDMLRVERIILDVMAGQLKWINFFGALLGALIGLSQALLFLFVF
ncbi:MAG: DUF445 family protein [Treponema sp.]|nr:DUF445 family protein [Treponema sp.]